MYSHPAFAEIKRKYSSKAGKQTFSYFSHDSESNSPLLGVSTIGCQSFKYSTYIQIKNREKINTFLDEDSKFIS